MSRKYLAPIALAVLLVVFPAEAAKRRSAAAPGGAAGPGPGGCHTFGLVRAGLVAGYHATTSNGGTADFEITYISDTPTKLITTQKTTTAQGTAEADTTVDGEIVGNLRGLKHIKVKGSSTVPVLGKITVETDIDFVPSLIAGPAAGWCTGAKWTVSPVTETITVKSPVSNITNTVTTIASEGEVLAVGESITVPAGTFQTVKYRGVIISGDNPKPAITWVSMADNIVVKQDTLDASGNVTSVTELTSLR